MKKINVIIEKYGYEITKTENSNLEELPKLNKCIALSQECLNTLRLYLRVNEFSSQKEEITFFKCLKPKIYGRLKYFAYKQNFLAECPDRNIQGQRVFIKKALKKLESSKKRHLVFYKYFEQNNDCFDDKYFIRGNNQLDLFSNNFHLNKDPQFSTSHDIKAAEIVAYDLITEFYDKKLESLKIKESKVIIKVVKPEILNDLSWTGSKTELVELLYALNTTGVFRNGKTDMKKLSAICKELFDIDLGNIYKTYGQIKAREKDTTKFLDLLKFNLIQRVNSEL